MILFTEILIVFDWFTQDCISLRRLNLINFISNAFKGDPGELAHPSVYCYLEGLQL